MQIRFLAATMAALLAAGAHAQPTEPRQEPQVAPTPVACLIAPPSAFRSEAELRELVQGTYGYRLASVGTEAGCYAVRASDRRGTHYEVRFLGSDLKMISRHAVKESP